MLQIIVLVVGLLALAGGGWAWLHNHDNAVEAAYQAQIDAKEAELRIAADKAKQEAANHITDMQAAYEAGEAAAPEKVRTIYVRGQANVAKDAGLSNPQCVMSDDSLRYLRGALAGMRTATIAGEGAATVPRPGTADGGNVQRTLPQQSQEYGTVGSMSAPARSDGDGVSLPATGNSAVRGHPKPIPIGK